MGDSAISDPLFLTTAEAGRKGDCLEKWWIFLEENGGGGGEGGDSGDLGKYIEGGKVRIEGWGGGRIFPSSPPPPCPLLQK